MGRLKQLVVENFKSYEGTHIVGPFDDFNCIIGPNGAGKSNMMDAISFVLGIQSKQLRSTKLKELVYRRNNEKIMRRTSVELVYELSENETIEHHNNSGLVSFSRSLAVSGISSYCFNKREISYQEYEDILSQLGVLIKARNFLVFQGDIESVASKTPQDLTGFLEQISGSINYRNEYMDLTRQRESVEESVLFTIQKKKMYTTQFKEIKQQKDEADKYQELSSNLADKKSSYTLFQIWLSKSDLSNHQDLITSLTDELTKIKQNELNVDDSISSEKKELAKVNKAAVSVEKDLLNKTNELTNILLPQITQFKSKIRNLMNRKEELLSSKTDVEKDQITQQDNILKLQGEIINLSEKEKYLQEELNALEQSDIYMNLDTIKEYSRLRELATSQIFKEKSELLLIEQDVNNKFSHIKRLENQVRSINQEISSNSATISEIEERLLKLKKANEENENEIDAVTIYRNSLNEQFKLRENEYKKLNIELLEVNSNLREIGDDKKRINLENKLNEAIETMKRIFKGVHGKLVDLINPIQKKYNIAITVAAGKHMDAIIVDTKQTAGDCIKYLKDQRIGICTFLPLNNIYITSIPDRLRNLGLKFKLCVDLIDCQDIYKPVVNYAFGSTIVVDSLEDAQELCFQRNEKVKVVTMIGSVISKSGAMTGGTLPNKSGNRFDEKDTENLYKKQKEIENKLLLLRDNNNLKQDILDAEIKIKSLQSKINFSKSDIDVSQQRVLTLQNQINSKKILLEHIQQELINLIKDKNFLQDKISELNNRIILVENEIFTQFSKKLGIDNIRIYEESKLLNFNSKINEIKLITEQKAVFQSHLHYENKKNFAIVLQNVINQINEIEDSITACNNEIGLLEKNQTYLNDVIQDVKSKLLELSKLKTSLNNNLKLLQSSRLDILKQKDVINKKISNEEILIEKSRSILYELLQKAQVEEISLPTIEIDESIEIEKSKLDSDLIWTGTQYKLFVDTDPGSTHKSKRNVRQRQLKEHETASTEHFKDQARVLMVDLSSMNQYKSFSKQQLQETDNLLVQQITQSINELEKMQPNMHASERFDAIYSKLRECNDELDQAKEKSKELSNRFEEVKSLRQHLFMECYKYVSESLSVIYKDLTRSSKHPLGGNAYLTLDNTDEAYNGGIRFTAMPPMKRFRDMDQLSGGEKTIAALALLFSIHSYRQAPFFVLDEVDAALDNINVRKVCNYVKQRSKDFQCIVISLKDLFYENADCLIGICKDVNSQSSKIFTLDLKKFDLPTNKQVSFKGDFRLIEDLDMVNLRSQSSNLSQGSPRSNKSVESPSSTLSSGKKRYYSENIPSIEKTLYGK